MTAQKALSLHLHASFDGIGQGFDVVTVFFHLLWLVCGLGAAVFAASAAVSGKPVGVLLALGFGVASVLAGPDLLPDVAWVGGLAAMAAIAQLVRPGWHELLAVFAGILAGLLVSLLRIEGFPLSAALLLAGTIPVASAYLAAKRPEYAPVKLREEALLLMCAVGLFAAISPSVASGWQTARTLNIDVDSGLSHSIPVWVLTLSGVSAGMGGLFSLWRHR